MALRKISTEEWASVIGEGIHTGFRKGSEHPRSSEYWNLISTMPDDLWNDVLDYCVYGLKAMNLIEVSHSSSEVE